MQSPKRPDENILNCKKPYEAFDIFIVSGFILALIYNSYRYPFQIGDSGTSPGFSDTPIYLQVGKYIIFLVISFVYVTYFLWGKKNIVFNFRKKEIIPFFSSAVLLIIPFLFSVILNKAFYFVESLFWMIAFICLAGFRFSDGVFCIKKIWNLLFVFYCLSVVFFVLEVTLFFVFGRLPALSYENSISVRFGGIWDDPNGFCIFLSFYTPMIFIYFKKFAAICIMLIQSVLMLGTQSLTGIAAGIAALFLTIIVGILFSKKTKYYYNALVVLLIFSAVIALFILSNKVLFDAVLSFYKDFLDLKSGSIEGHAKSIEFLNDINFLVLMGLTPLDTQGESGIINWMTSFGVVYIAAFFLFTLNFLTRAIYLMRISSSAKSHSYYAGVICFTFSYVISLINLPVDKVFPLNMLFVLFAVTVFGGVSNSVQRNVTPT